MPPRWPRCCWTRPRKQKDIGAHAVLRRYERWRKGDNLAMVSITGGFKYLFGNDLPVVSQLRNWGVDLTNAATPVKNLIMRQGEWVRGGFTEAREASLNVGRVRRAAP